MLERVPPHLDLLLGSDHEAGQLSVLGHHLHASPDRLVSATCLCTSPQMASPYPGGQRTTTAALMFLRAAFCFWRLYPVCSVSWPVTLMSSLNLTICVRSAADRLLAVRSSWTELEHGDMDDPDEGQALGNPTISLGSESLP